MTRNGNAAGCCQEADVVQHCLQQALQRYLDSLQDEMTCSPKC